MMQAGKLDRRVTIERATTVQDAGSGQEVPTWHAFPPVSASWRRASARETLASAEVAAAVSDVFEIRWTPNLADLNAKDRLIYDGRTYDIVEATEINRREGIRIAAIARADQ